AHLVLENGLARLEPVNFGVAGGDIRADVRMDARTDAIRTRLRAQLRGIELAQLFPDAELTRDAAGRLGGNIALTGGGNSIAAMLAGADGDVALGMGRGEISNLLLELAGIDIYESLKFLLGRDRKAQVRCAFADFDVASGTMQARALAFDTSDTIIVGQGQVDLEAETLDIELRPRPKDRSILALRSPLHLGGTFAAPSFRPDFARLGLRGAVALALGSIAPPAALLATRCLGRCEAGDCGGRCAKWRPTRCSTGDVALQLVELVLLVLDHRLDQVADRDDAHHRAAFEHRQVADALLGHQLHARGDDVVRGHGDHIACHDRAHRGVLRRAALEHDLARVVALGQDPAQLPGFRHQHRADALERHQPDRFDHRRIRRHRVDLRTLAVQQLPHRTHLGCLPLPATRPRILRRARGASRRPGTAAAAWIPRTAGPGTRRSCPARPAAPRPGTGSRPSSSASRRPDRHTARPWPRSTPRTGRPAAPRPARHRSPAAAARSRSW